MTSGGAEGSMSRFFASLEISEPWLNLPRTGRVANTFLLETLKEFLFDGKQTMYGPEVFSRGIIGSQGNRG